MLHLHLRKRKARTLEPYPATSPWKRLLDRIIYAAGIVGPAMSIPQIVLIYSTKNATGLAPESWLVWCVLNIPWILYGIVHKETPIVMTYTLWFFCNGLIFVGAVLY
jgi:uncharacterized protein with PQ loop repeat